MNPLPDNPRDVGVPHNSWRPSQRAALQVARDAYYADKQFLFQQMPTGCGKTGLSAGLGADDKVLAVVHTLSLGRQYESQYGFSFVAGRAEYPCVLPEKVASWEAKGREPTAADCHFAKMDDCDYAGQCPYLVARRKAMASRRTVVTVPYLLLSKTMQERSGILVVDECHGLPEHLLGFSELSIDQATIDYFGLPAIPLSDGYGPKLRGDIMTPAIKTVVMRYVESCIKSLTWVLDEDRMAHDIEGTKAKRLYDRLERLLENLQDESASWFMNCGRNAVQTYRRGQYIDGPGIVVKGLDARSVAARLWSNKRMIMMMSATIGSSPAWLAHELGLSEYEWASYPHPVPPEYRPVFDLQFERMTHQNISKNPQLFELQARRIAAFIRWMDPEWRGVVMAPSKYKVDQLRNWLSRLLGDRVLWPTKSARGSQVTADVEQFRNSQVKGAIAILTTQGGSEGHSFDYDLARWIVPAGVAHDDPFDPFVIARGKMPGGRNYSITKAHIKTVQGSQRASRSEVDSKGDWLYNCSGLACGSMTTDQAMRVYPDFFKSSIKKQE